MTEKKIQPKKAEAVGALREKMSQIDDFIFTDYRGLTVAQITNIRDKLRPLQTEYKVVKNNFARIVFKERNQECVSDMLIGPTAIAFAKGETGPVAKVLLDLTKEFPLQIRGGLVAGKLLQAKDVEAFSKLPTRKELIAKLMGTIKAPISNMAYGLNGIASKLVRTLKAVADKKA